MTDGRDAPEILDLALTSVTPLGRCHALAAYLLDADGDPLRPDSGAPDPAVLPQLTALAGDGGPVIVAGQPWAWAYPLRAFGVNHGYLTVGGPQALSDDEQFLLTALAQCTGSALGQAAMRNTLADQADRLQMVTTDLGEANAELRRHSVAHEALARAAAGGQNDRVQAIADALHLVTSLPVVVEDRFGTARASAGLSQPATPSPLRRRAELLRVAQQHAAPVRDRDRLIAVSQPRDEVLGTISLIDPARTAGESHKFALAHAALVLSGELAHLQALAEVELRLRRDLVDDLLTGTDEKGAYARAESVGHDLRQPHRVLAIGYPDRPIDDQLTRSVEQATHHLRIRSLLTRRAACLVMLAQPPEQWAANASWKPMHVELHRQLGAEVAIGVGRVCEQGDHIPQSWHDARRALTVRMTSRVRDGLTSYDELGFYRVLGTGANSDDIDEFVSEWLGKLIAYDETTHSELTRTLARYLDCGGNYDETAAAVVIHRSTLRYRLQRIREISGLELNDVDTRLNLHVATRAWAIQAGGQPRLP